MASIISGHLFLERAWLTAPISDRVVMIITMAFRVDRQKSGSPILRDSYNKRFLRDSNSRNLNASIGGAHPSQLRPLSVMSPPLCLHRAATPVLHTAQSSRSTSPHAHTRVRIRTRARVVHAPRMHSPAPTVSPSRFRRLHALEVADRCQRRCRPLLAIPSAQLRHTHAHSRARLPTRSLTHALAHARARPRMLSPTPTASPLVV